MLATERHSVRKSQQSKPSDERVLLDRVAKETQRIRESFLHAASHPEESTIAKRMLRAASIDKLLDTYAELTTLGIFGMGSCPADATTMISSVLVDSMAHYCRTAPLASEMKDVAEQYRNYRRLITEAKSMFQTLNTYFGKDHVEQTIQKVAESKLANLPNFACQQIMVGTAMEGLANFRRNLKSLSPEECRQCRLDAKQTFAFAVELFPATMNKKVILVDIILNGYINGADEYYKSYAWPEDVDSFLAEVSKVLDFEFNLALEVLPEATNGAEPVKRSLQARILTGRSTAVIENKKSGIASTLIFPHLCPERFFVLLNIFDFSTAVVENIKAAVAESVRLSQVCSLPVRDLAAGYCLYVDFLMKGTQPIQTHPFLKKLQESFTQLIHDHKVIAVEAAELIDSTIKKHLRSSNALLPFDDNEMKVIDDLIRFFHVCTEQDWFVARYKSLLAGRLTTLRNPSRSLELHVLQKIATFVLPHHALALRMMIDDATVNRRSPSVVLCNELIWPCASALLGSDSAIACPPLLQRAVDAATDVALSGIPDRTIRSSVDHWSSSAEVNLCCGAITVVVFGTLPQLCALELLAAADEPQSLKDVCSKLSIADPLVGFAVLNSLETSNVVTYVDKKFSVNKTFLQSLKSGKKIQLSSVSWKVSKREEQHC